MSEGRGKSVCLYGVVSGGVGGVFGRGGGGGEKFGVGGGFWSLARQSKRVSAVVK